MEENAHKSLRFYRIPKWPSQSLVNVKENENEMVGQATCDHSVTTVEVTMAAACDGEDLQMDNFKQNDQVEAAELTQTEKWFSKLDTLRLGGDLEEKVCLLIEMWTKLTDECRLLPCIFEIFNALIRKTIETVLSDEWQFLGHSTKTQMARTMSVCSQQLGHVVVRAPRLCSTLVMAIYDPWGEPILKKIVQGEDGLNDCNVEKFLSSEPPELVLGRVESLSRAGNEDTALHLCQCYLRMSNHCDRMQLDYETDVNPDGMRWDLLPFVEWVVRILYKKKRLRDIVKETANCTCHEGVHLIRRIKEGDSECLGLAEILAHLFLVRDLLYPSAYCCTRELMSIWTSLQAIQRRSPREVSIAARKLVVLHASTSAHFYLFVDVLWEEFGRLLFPLYLEMYIRGLTADLNHLEVARQEQSTATILEMEAHVAIIYIKLGSLFNRGQEVFARECVMSAFSVEPTPERLQLLRYLTLEIAVNEGKLVVPLEVSQEDEGEAEMTAHSVLGNVVDAVVRSESEGSVCRGDDLDLQVWIEPVPETNELLNCVEDDTEESRCKKVVDSDSKSESENDDVSKEVEAKVNEMVSYVHDGRSDSLLHSLAEKSVRITKCNCGGRCTTPDVVDAIQVTGPRTDYFHPILDTQIPGIHHDLLKDLVIVLESTRHNRLRCLDDWESMRIECEQYLHTMSAIQIMLKHNLCYGSVDSETDSISEDEDFRFHSNAEECVSTTSLVGEGHDVDSVCAKRCKSKTSERHGPKEGATAGGPKSKPHRHSNELAKRKCRKQRRRAKKDRDRELTVRHVLFDGLDENKKPRKKRKRPPCKKGKDKLSSAQGIDITKTDLASIVNPNARILLSRLEDSAGHRLDAQLLSRFDLSCCWSS